LPAEPALSIVTIASAGRVQAFSLNANASVAQTVSTEAKSS
jgi:hypothetical protein